MNHYSKNIKPFVEDELHRASAAIDSSQPELAFRHLENAHILGQESTFYHVKVHWLMMLWGIRQKNIKEVIGQILRMTGAATKTAIRLVPAGNTGGSNVSPFRVMPVKNEHAEIIASAKARM